MKQISLEEKTASEIRALVPVGHWVAMSSNKTKYAFGEKMSETTKKLHNQNYNGHITLVQNWNTEKKYALFAA